MDESKETEEKIKHNREVVALWMLNAEARREEYRARRVESIGRSPSVNAGGGGNASSPVEGSVMQLEQLANTEKWLDVVSLAEKTLSQQRRLFLHLRREAFKRNQRKGGRMNWMLYVQREYARRMAGKYQTDEKEYWISEPTLYRWWEKILDTAERIAYMKGCKFQLS